MADPDFTGPRLKTERAKHHIDHLEGIFKVHIAKQRKALVPKYNRKPRTNVVSGGFPRHTPTILGDALHNLRAALDHAYCELVTANGHTVHERSFFPIVNPGGKDNWQSRKASMEGHEKAGNGPGAEIIAALTDEVQPYPGGNGEDLVRLHVLDIADKHQVLLPAEQRMFIEDITFTNEARISNLTIISKSGHIFGFGAGEGLHPKHKQKATFEICFGKGQPYEGEPVIPILRSLAVRVDETLQLLEQRAKKTS